MINPIRQFRPIIGDDEPIYSMYYRDVPTGFRFDDLDIPETYININAIKERLIDNANRYYRNYEVNGVTLQDFLDNLQLDFNLNADYFEKMLSEIGILEIICGNTEEYEHSVNRDDNTFNTQSIKNNESISKNINDVKNKTNIENGVEDYIGNIDDITNKNNLESNKKNITKNTDSTEKISNVENEITDKKFVESNNNNESINDIENNLYDKSITGSTSNNEEKIENKNNSGINNTNEVKTEKGTLDVSNVKNNNEVQTQIPLTYDTQNLDPTNKTDKFGSNIENGQTNNDNTINDNVSTEIVNNENTIENKNITGSNNNSEIESDTKSKFSNKDSSGSKNNTENLYGVKNVIEDKTIDGSDTTTESEDKNNVGNEIKNTKETNTNKNNINKNEFENALRVDTTENNGEKSVNGSNVNLYNDYKKYIRKVNRMKDDEIIELFNNFFDKYPNILRIFIGFFKDDFIIYESLYY